MGWRRPLVFLTIFFEQMHVPWCVDWCGVPGCGSPSVINWQPRVLSIHVLCFGKDSRVKETALTRGPGKTNRPKG